MAVYTPYYRKFVFIDSLKSGMNFVSVRHHSVFVGRSGFVIFYDFMLQVDPAYTKVQLVTSIYNGPHQICSPTVLPERECFALVPFPAMMQPSGGQLGFTLLSTSQPVQRSAIDFSGSLFVTAKSFSEKKTFTVAVSNNNNN